MIGQSRGWVASSFVLWGAAAVSGCSSNPGEPATGAASSSITTSAAVALPGLQTPAWATSAGFLGRMESGNTLTVQVHLRMQNIDAARAELADISNPKSARYGQYLSDADFDVKYGPSDDDVAVVRAHLESNGLHVTDLPANRAYITAQGTVAQIEGAFATQIGTYHVSGEGRRAPMTAAVLPTDVASRVAAVLGLSTPPRARPGLSSPVGARPRFPGGSGSTTPEPICSDYWGQYADTTDPGYGRDYARPTPRGLCTGYIPAQVREAYDLESVVRSGIDGRGQTVAIVDPWESPTLLQDAQRYASNHDPQYPLAASHFSEYSVSNDFGAAPFPGDIQNWYTEQTLDVEAAHAIAPHADIAFVAALSDSPTDLIAAVNLVITQHLASVVSNSYSWPEAPTVALYGPELPAIEQLIVQGTLKGIGFYVASGDHGDNAESDVVQDVTTTFTPTTSFPASLPWVTGVGGTALALDAHNGRVFEVGWESSLSLLLNAGYDGNWVDYLENSPTPPFPATSGPQAWWPAAPGGYYYGAGGGPSMTYAQPSYQARIVPDSLALSGDKRWRVVPDVAMLASPDTGFEIGQTQDGVYTEFAYGGTSLATPLFAATMALAQQVAGRSLGFANPALYQTAGRALSDVVPEYPRQDVAYPGGLIVTFDYHGLENSNATAIGYDTATGLGSPNGAQFLYSLVAPRQ